MKADVKVRCEYCLRRTWRSLMIAEDGRMCDTCVRERQKPTLIEVSDIELINALENVVNCIDTYLSDKETNLHCLHVAREDANTVLAKYK